MLFSSLNMNFNVNQYFLNPLMKLSVITQNNTQKYFPFSFIPHLDNNKILKFYTQFYDVIKIMCSAQFEGDLLFQFMNQQIAVFLLIIASALSCNVNPNTKDIINSEPVLLKEVTNGQKFMIGNLTDPEGNYLYIAKIKGTPYEMGYAFGQLFSSEVKENINGFYGYYLGQLQEILTNASLPTFLAKGLTGGVHHLALGLLDLNIMITKKYTNPRYYEEISGIAKGAKMKALDISRLNIFPQLIKAACTVAGVWNKASTNGETLHIRSLDWDSGNPISKFPLITVYHPSQKGLQKHANIGWAGFVGALTGFSPYVSLGEKVWYPPGGSVKTTRYGNPWTYVIRDVLYQATNISTALEILTNSNRTCTIHLGLGSKNDHSFRMLEYGQHVLNNYDDKNYTNYNPKSHPKKDGIAYFDKFIQPSGNDCVGGLLTNSSYYGKWDMENLWRVIGRSHETGDTQHIVFNLERQEALISYSRIWKQGDKTINDKAFIRSPIFVDFNKLWKNF